MTTPATREYLFVPDVQALRNKIAHAHGTVAYLWKSLQALPYADGNGRYYPAFLYLVTGREEYARAALAELKSAMEFSPWTCTSIRGATRRRWPAWQ